MAKFVGFRGFRRGVDFRLLVEVGKKHWEIRFPLVRFPCPVWKDDGLSGISLEQWSRPKFDRRALARAKAIVRAAKS